MTRIKLFPKAEVFHIIKMTHFRQRDTNKGIAKPYN